MRYIFFGSVTESCRHGSFFITDRKLLFSRLTRNVSDREPPAPWRYSMSSEFMQGNLSTIKIIPPSEGPLRRNSHTYDLIRQCIHCGFCLPNCATYAVLGVEMDSSRGRIYQMQAVADGRLEISDDFVEHMYCCVGCRAFETACPSGVQFGKLIEAAREQIQIEVTHPSIQSEQRRALQMQAEKPVVEGDETYPLHAHLPDSPALESPGERLLRRFFFDIMLPSRIITSLVFAGLKFYQRSGLQAIVHRTGLLDLVNALPTPFQGKLKTPEELMYQAGGDLLPAPLPEITPALGRQRYRVGFISGCIMDQVFRDINEATIRGLSANGCEVINPSQNECW